MRILKIVSAILTLAALGVFAVSCGSSSKSQARLVYAIPDEGGNVDIAIDGNNVTTNLAFGSVWPSTSGYSSVSSGSRKIEVRPTGDTNASDDIINSTTSFNGGSPYTLVATGRVTDNPPDQILSVFSDDNTAPTSGNFKLRMIHASPSGGSLDVYVIQGGSIQGLAPNIATLTYKSASSYLGSLAAGTWQVFLTPAGSQAVISNLQYTFASGKIYTLVLTDNNGSQSINPTPLQLNDN